MITFTADVVFTGCPDLQKVKKWIIAVIQQCSKRVGVISYLFCDDEHMIKVNNSFLKHDTYTDIITFDYVEGDVISGDILISVDRVKDNSQRFNTSFENELLRVIIHGIFHLLGQNDKTENDAVEMRKLENSALALWKTIV